MKRFFSFPVVLILMMIVTGLAGCSTITKDKGTQALVGVGSFGVRSPALKGNWSLYLVNPHNKGKIILEKIVVMKDNGAIAAEITDLKTSKGQDNIMEPYESWEFISEKYTNVPQDGKETYTAWVYWRPEQGFANELMGWWYQKIFAGTQLILLQYPLIKAN